MKWDFCQLDSLMCIDYSQFDDQPPLYAVGVSTNKLDIIIFNFDFSCIELQCDFEKKLLKPSVFYLQLGIYLALTFVGNFLLKFIFKSVSYCKTLNRSMFSSAIFSINHHAKPQLKT